MGRLMLGLLLLCAPSAYAQGADSERAKELYSNGKRLFEEERYGEALIAWQASHDMSGRPLLLFNIALAQEKLGEISAAIETLYKYRVYAPAEEQDMLVAKIAELQAMVAETPEPEPEPVAEADPEPEPKDAAESEPENARKLGPTLVWTATGVAAASGLTFGLLARSSGKQAEDYCSDASVGLVCLDEVEDFEYQQNSRALAADISWGVAAVGVGAGIWMMARDSDSKQATRLQIGPSFVGVRGGF